MASARVPVVSCTFLRFGCPSDHALFAPTYTRSNKKRNAKLLRCFPHCCPRHVPRSYCGCSLHLLVTFESAQAAAAANQNSDLLVCARFESTTTSAIAGVGDVVTAMTPDETVALPPSVTTLPGLKPSESDWIRAEKADDAYQRQFPENVIVYEFNNRRNPMWYYSYESGSTKAQRGMKHVLAAYVLVLHSESKVSNLQQDDGRADDSGVQLATVIIRHQSPSFTMVSYRRQNIGSDSKHHHTTQSTTDGCSTIKVEGGTLTQLSKSRPPLPALAQIIQRSDLIHFRSRSEENNVAVDQTRNSETVREAASGLLQYQTQSEMGQSVHDHQQCCPICQEQTAQHSLLHYRNTIDLLQPLLVLQIFMCSVPLSAFSFCFTELDSRIQRDWLANLSPVSRNQQSVVGMEEAARILMEDVTSSFSLDNFLVDDMEMTSVEENEETILSSCAILLATTFSAMGFQYILSSMISATDMTSQNTSRVSCEQFCQFVKDIFDELERLLPSTVDTSIADYSEDDKYSKISTLVDEILSLIYSEPRFHSLRAAVSKILLQCDDSLVMKTQDLFGLFSAYIQQACNDLNESKEADDEQKAEHVNPISPAETVMKHSTSTQDTPGYRHDFSCLSIQRPGNNWCKRWFLDTSTLSIVPTFSKRDSGDAAYNFVYGCNSSLLGTMTFLQALMVVDLTLISSQLIVESAMSETLLRLPAVSGTILKLDGTTYALESFPSGLPLGVATAMLDNSLELIVYKGKVAGDGLSVNIVLTLLPKFQTCQQVDARNSAPLVVAHKFDVHMILSATDDSRRSSLSVFVAAFVARLSSKQLVGGPLHEGSVTKYFTNEELVVDWSPKLEIGMTYFAVSQKQTNN
ncbi:hypothetical protein PHMEG_0004689 [Phytophthora megakarya]|uniref:Uncharacterized protein n=1 Tax=Phytophthora megakarya TaxID=4795 RepID=A0A225WUS4_9STRA|nr:hypothetical protein PHMEG_0004689 [Phytophthora megakarya]